jgi:orotate phosphoribosyltransferase
LIFIKEKNRRSKMIILRGVNFGNVFAAAGALNFFGNGWPYHKIYKSLFPSFDFTGATHITKTTTLEPCKGNMPLDANFQPKEIFPECVVVKFRQGVVLNAVGLSGPGAKTLFERGCWQKRNSPFLISFAAVGRIKEDRIEETNRFVYILKKELDFFYAPVGLEINISCPNIGHNSSELEAEAVGYLIIASALDIPLVLKLNVLVSDEIVKNIVDSGLCDAIDISNTIPWGQLPERIDWKKLFGSDVSPLAHLGGGGLSGKPLLPIVCDKIKSLRRAGIKLPIIGGGGILHRNDVDLMKAAGADAVSIGVVSILRPWRVKSIIDCANRLFAEKDKKRQRRRCFMKCDKCGGSGRQFVVTRVVQGQSYGPETEGRYVTCWKCDGKGEVRPFDMNEQEVLQVLGKVGAVIADSHIVYTSGKHGTAYVNKDAVYPHTKETSDLCRAIAEQFANDGVGVVIAPAIGGVILSQWVARHLSEITGREVLGVYAEKEGDGFVVKRGYDKLLIGKNVLVVEDVLTTGGSAKKVVEATRALGGNIVGLGVLCNRGGVTPQDVANPPKLFALVNVRLDAWDEADCPLCKQNVPINTEVGKGREYLARKKNQ